MLGPLLPVYGFFHWHITQLPPSTEVLTCGLCPNDLVDFVQWYGYDFECWIGLLDLDEIMDEEED